jgi:N12 class adenine-specific DNA methylase
MVEPDRTVRQRAQRAVEIFVDAMLVKQKSQSRSMSLEKATPVVTRIAGWSRIARPAVWRRAANLGYASPGK